MVILSFKLCGLSVKKGWLFGCRDNPPLHTVNMLLCRAVVLNRDGAGKMIEAVRGLCSDPSWLIENSEEVRAARDHAVRQARKEFAEDKDREIESLRERLERASDEKMKLATENHTLRRAIEIVEEG